MVQRYPENTTADIDDFRRSGWKAAIGASNREDYHGMWRTLSEAARVAIENGDASQGKVLWLLADACSMVFKPSSTNEPLQPITVMKGRRTSLPEDFQEQDINLLAQISEEVDDPWLQARLADLVWLLERPRSLKHALLAIDAYRRIPLDVKTWIRDGQECWERAINLSRILRAAAGERLKEIEAAITAAFDAAKEEDGFFALWLAELLLKNGFGEEKKRVIAERLQSLAHGLDNRGDLHRACDFFAASVQWFKRAGDKAKAAEVTVCVAEVWIKKALAHPSPMVAVSFYEKAIQVYRMVPRTERSLHKVEERLAELHRWLNEAGKRSLDEMVVYTAPPPDITEIVEGARNAVKGKEAIDAMLALANIHRGFQVARLREQAEGILRDHPLQALFPATHFSRDGRVIAKRPGVGSGDDEYQAAVWAEMIENFQMELSLVVQSTILPALEVVLLEHRIPEREFVSLADRSPIVPPGRARLFGFWV